MENLLFNISPMVKSTVLVAVFVLTFFTGCSRLQELNRTSTATLTPVAESTPMQAADSDTADTPSEALEAPTEMVTEKSGVPGARQVSFVNEDNAKAFVADGPTVYFFKANWCPTCQTAQRDLDKNIGNLPAGVTIVTVDYDKEAELKKKYAITYQHTWVQIDANGNELAKWQGGGVDQITSNIKTL